MIYLDVTGACLLPLQNGISRTTRQLARLIGQHDLESRPICWQPFRGAYTELTPKARRLLNSFHPGNLPAPRDSTLPLLYASLKQLPAWPSAVPLPHRLDGTDVLLLTSLFPDNRLEYLLRLSDHPGRKMAIFHDAIPLLDPNVRGWEKQRHVKTLKLLARMDQLIAVSHASRGDLLALWQMHQIKSAPIQVIPWPVPFTDPRPDFIPPGSQEKNVLYVSRLKQVKNHSTLLLACENLWRSGCAFSLTLIGGEDEARESAAILREIRRLQAAGHALTWRAQISESELSAAYRQASFTVFPSTQEGFGLPIVESFWHGRAVICSAKGAMGEISAGAGCLQVEIEDADILTEAMRGLLMDEMKCQTLAREAYARRQRSWDDYWRELSPLVTRAAG